MKSIQAFRQPLFSNLRRAIRPTCRLPRSTTSYRPFHSSPLIRLLSRNPQRTSVKHLIKRFASNQPSNNINNPPSLSLTQRMRKLSREYGWSALGVYFLLSALDFPFCFLAVRWLGTDRIGRVERVVLDWFWRVVPYPFLAKAEDRLDELGVESIGNTSDSGVGYDHGVKEAEELNRSENASIWTQLALAYAIHKSFIFIRIPVAAAVTPKVVKVLRGWGWDIGKRRPKAGKSG